MTSRPTICRRWIVCVAAFGLAACGQAPASTLPALQSVQVRTISGVVWVDLDGDGNRDGDEPAPSKGVRVLATDRLSVSADDFIDEDGSYELTVTGDGDLLIEVVSSGGLDRYGFTTARTLTLAEGAEGGANFDFGLDVASVAGTVWVDLDGDLVRQSDESASVDARVQMRTAAGNANPFDDVALTDANGNFAIDVLADSYVVSVSPPDDQVGRYVARAVFAGEPVPWYQETVLDVGPPDCPSAIFDTIDTTGPIIADLVAPGEISPGCLAVDRDDIDIALVPPLVDVSISADRTAVAALVGDEFDIELTVLDLEPLLGFRQELIVTRPDGVEFLAGGTDIPDGPWPVNTLDDGRLQVFPSPPFHVFRSDDFPVVTMRFRALEAGEHTVTIEADRRSDPDEVRWTDTNPGDETVELLVSVLERLPTVS